MVKAQKVKEGDDQMEKKQVKDLTKEGRHRAGESGGVGGIRVGRSQRY